MALKITTLMEDMEDDNHELLHEHGLSLYIEFEGKKILFDTGQSDQFLHNAKKLHKSMNDLDYLMISHAHYDHAEGVPALVNNYGEGLNMYVGQEFFVDKYSLEDDGCYHNAGISYSEQELLQKGVIVHKVTEDVTYLDDHIMIFKNFKRSNTFEEVNKKFFICKEGNYGQDEFGEEIVLGLNTPKGMVLIAGCSHIGIVNILRTIRQRITIPIYGLIGGTHLIHASDVRINQTIEELKGLNAGFLAFSHCTGTCALDTMKQEFKEHYIINNTGHVILMDD